jgi:tetratricopeptide (TPR) repeat protein
LTTSTLPPHRQSFVDRASASAQLRIDPLGEQGAGELLDGLLGADSSIQPLTALLIRRTEGNPFFLEESIRALVETGMLVGERGAYRLTQPVEEIRVPSTVQSLLAARIDRLPPEEKRLLQTTSVIGKDVPFVLLQRIADTPDARLRAGLSRLQAGELLYAVSLSPDLEYTFKHVLTHEVAYGGLLQERRRALHARIVDAIEALYPDRLDEHVERLAHHALRGERWEAALAYCREAGTRDVARSAHHVAVHHLEQAIDAARRLPESPDACTAMLDLHLELRNALVPLGALDQEAACLRQAVALAEMLGDQHRLGLALAQLGAISLAVGDHDTSIAAVQRALAIALATGDRHVEGTAIYILGNIHHLRGEYRRAVELIRDFLGRIPRDRVAERFGAANPPALTHRANLVHCLAELGDFAAARAMADEALKLCEFDDRPNARCYVSFVIGAAQLVEGHLERARLVLEPALNLARTWSLPSYEALAGANLGYAFAPAGRVSDSLALLELAAEGKGEWGYSASQSRWVSYFGEALLLAGRPDDALRQARRALDLSRARGHRGQEAYALRLLGEIGARNEPPDVEEAETRYRDALSLAEELGMRPLQAHGHLGLGKLYRRAGHLDEARAELATAVAMLREMGMAFWLPEAEGELAEAGGGSGARISVGRWARQEGSRRRGDGGPSSKVRNFVSSYGDGSEPRAMARGGGKPRDINNLPLFPPVLLHLFPAFVSTSRTNLRTYELLKLSGPTPTGPRPHVTDRRAIGALRLVHRHGPSDRGGSRIDRRRAGGYASA